jgi:hypothetical protein
MFLSIRLEAAKVIILTKSLMLKKQQYYYLFTIYC